MKNNRKGQKHIPRYTAMLFIKSRSRCKVFFGSLVLASGIFTIAASPAKAGIATEIFELVIRSVGHLVVWIGVKNPELAPYIWTAIGTLLLAAIIYGLHKKIKNWEVERELSSRIYTDDSTAAKNQIFNNPGKALFMLSLAIIAVIAGEHYTRNFRRNSASGYPDQQEKWQRKSPDKISPDKEPWRGEQNDQRKYPRGKESSIPFQKKYDAAIAMQPRVFYYPDNSIPSLNTDDYKKAAGDLARIQHKLLINRRRSKELPTVLIGFGVWENEKCNQRLPSIGIYQYGGSDCDQLITVNFTNGNTWYEHQIEVIITLAHEWGHHIINLSGEKISGINNELLSDCFAGVYLAYLQKHALLSEQELYNGIRMMTQIGSTHGEGIHGSKYQRANGLASGYGYAVNQYNNESKANWDAFCKGLENVIDLQRGLP